MAIQTKTKEQDGVTILTVNEKSLLHENAPYLKEKLFVLVNEGHKNIILDLNEVERMDSSGMSALLFGKRQANAQQGDLVLLNPQEAVRKILQIAQLTRVFELFEDEQEAVQSFQE